LKKKTLCNPKKETLRGAPPQSQGGFCPNGGRWQVFFVTTKKRCPWWGGGKGGAPQPLLKKKMIGGERVGLFGGVKGV